MIIHENLLFEIQLTAKYNKITNCLIHLQYTILKIIKFLKFVLILLIFKVYLFLFVVGSFTYY